MITANAQQSQPRRGEADQIKLMGFQLGLAGACGRPDVVQGGGVHALHRHEIGRRMDDAVPGLPLSWE